MLPSPFSSSSCHSGRSMTRAFSSPFEAISIKVGHWAIRFHRFHVVMEMLKKRDVPLLRKYPSSFSGKSDPFPERLIPLRMNFRIKGTTSAMRGAVSLYALLSALSKTKAMAFASLMICSGLLKATILRGKSRRGGGHNHSRCGGHPHRGGHPHVRIRFTVGVIPTYESDSQWDSEQETGIYRV